MLISYTVSVFIYIVILLVGTITTLLYMMETRFSQEKTVHYLQSFLYSFLAYVAAAFLYTIMAFGNNQNGVFEIVLLFSDMAYFGFIVSGILLLKELSQAVFLKEIRVFILITVLYAMILEGMIFLSEHFAERFLEPLDSPIRLLNFFYLFLVISAGIFYLARGLWMPKGKRRIVVMAGALMFILYSVFEFYWMVFAGLVEKTETDITVRFDMILFFYLAGCTFWLYQKIRSRKEDSSVEVKAEAGGEAATISLSELYSLTKRETEICQLVLKGLSNPEIADQLCISENTVKHHLNNSFKKIEVKSRYELIARISGLSDEK